jgi:hypothetical protein
MRLTASKKPDASPQVLRALLLVAETDVDDINDASGVVAT